LHLIPDGSIHLPNGICEVLKFTLMVAPFDVQPLECFDETGVGGEEFQEFLVLAGDFYGDADWARVVEEVGSGDGEP
jgi:hypothetical protein